VRTADDLGTILQDFKPGQTVELKVVHDGKERTVRIKLAERPKNAAG
jgi:S1-C subfamily serine protease